MNSMAYFLLFSRLSRRTAIFWGHAVTSGVSQFDTDSTEGTGGGDYFISSTLFEPSDGGQDDYAEQLYLMRSMTTRFLPPVKPRLSLTGTLVVGRDIAHARIKDMLDAGEPMPQYLRDHAIYYAGPAKTPEGYASGSFRPTTAGRMDSYVEQFQAAGGSFVMLAKGNRSSQVTDACATHGGFYLGSIGGPAARLAKDSIRSVEVLEFPELGMEAVWKIEVEDFPAFIVVDDKGNDFYAEVTTPVKLR